MEQTQPPLDTPQPLSLLAERRSLRAIDPNRPVSPDVLARLLEAGRWAPSSANNQPWRFIVVNEPDALERAHPALAPGNRLWADRAPLLLVVAANPGDDAIADGKPYYLFDCGLATENVLLQGHAEGLVTHPMLGFLEEPMRAALGIPDPYRVVIVVAIGWPGRIENLPANFQEREQQPRARKPLTEIVHYNGWNAPAEATNS